MHFTCPALTRNWHRYAFAVQYHGGNALGFTYQGLRGENCIVYQPQSNNTIIQADLRGLESIEGRVRRALNCLVGRDNYQNIQVSSRTDRGVHAWRNTFQVDIRSRLQNSRPENERELTAQQSEKWNPSNLVHGLNFYLARLPRFLSEEEDDAETWDDTFVSSNRSASQRSSLSSLHFNNTIRILSAVSAPSIRVPNHNYNPNLPENDRNPKDLQWDVRFTATKRTYAYRILHSYDSWEHENEGYLSACHHSYPFEHDRAWRIHEKRTKQPCVNKKLCTKQSPSLDIEAMNHAGKYLTGTHDFTSVRGKGCQRSSPVVTIDDVWCATEQYHGEFGEGILNAVSRKNTTHNRNEGAVPREDSTLHTPDTLQLVTIVISGKSFLYHQVRNMVACLVEVGRGKLTPEDIKLILEQKNRAFALGMAPAHGLFLVDVEHGDFRF